MCADSVPAASVPMGCSSENAGPYDSEEELLECCN